MRKRLEVVRVIEFSPQQEGKVFFGAWVEVENSQGETMTFRIVGPDEIYGDSKGFISIDSPMARALLKKQEGDDAVVNTPEGIKEWTVTKISYSS